MKKTTKMAAVLAAMSVMVIGAVSTTMAANEGWNGNDDDGWTYVQDGVKVKGWQQINGVWYYFDKSGNMAQDELVTISGQTYYLSQSGAMATGWQRFDSDHDVYEELEDDLPEHEEDTIIDTDYQYEDEIWLYFDEHGVAAEDKWVKSDAGLWYYFEDLIMVRSDYSYLVGEKDYYGLDENGAMMVGWVRDNEDSSNDRPTGGDSTKAWYYYQSNGKQVTGENKEDPNGNWKKIDGTWYYFVTEKFADEIKEKTNKDVKPNAILAGVYIDLKDGTFYLNNDGKMATGVTKVADDTIVSGANINEETKTIGGIDICIAGNGKVDNGLKGDSYYISSYNDSKTLSYKKKDNNKNIIGKIENNVTVISGDVFDGKVRGQLAKECLVNFDGNLYYVDKYGEIVKNEALVIETENLGDFKVVFGSNGRAITGKDKAGEKVKAGKTYTVDDKIEIEILGLKVNVFDN